MLHYVMSRDDAANVSSVTPTGRGAGRAAEVAPAAAEAATTATIARRFARTGFVHRDRTTVELGAFTFLDGASRLFVVVVLDEPEAPAAPAVTVADNCSSRNRPELGKELMQTFVIG
jgi:hypothetical protein